MTIEEQIAAFEASKELIQPVSTHQQCECCGHVARLTDGLCDVCWKTREIETI